MKNITHFNADRPMTLGEILALSREYALEYNEDIATALKYVRAGTNEHDVNPGPNDTFALIEYTAKKGYYWNHNRFPEPESTPADAWDYKTERWEAACEMM